MSRLSNDLSFVRALCQKLRVPELKYLQDFGTSTDKTLDLEGVRQHFVLEVGQYEVSLLDHLKKHYEGAQKSGVNNIAFILDRCFDVWLRKNCFPHEIANILSVWRFSLFTIIFLEQKKVFQQEGVDQKKILASVIGLLELIATDCIGWSAVPERSKHLLLEQLNDVSTQVIANLHSNPELIEDAELKWKDFQDKQRSKFTKVTQRLIESESQLCWKRFSFWCAQSYIDSVFARKKLPESLQCFLDSYWLNSVAVHLVCEDGLHVRLDAEIDKLTQSLMKAFCQQGKALFQLADSLVDDLKKVLDRSNIAYDESIFNALEESMVSLLKQEFCDSFVPYTSVPTDITLNEQFSHFDISRILYKDEVGDSSVPQNDSVEKLNLEESDWFVMGTDQASSPSMILLNRFDYAGLFLFGNYLGMKTGIYTRQELDHLLNQGEIKPYKQGESFSVVFNACIKGLMRVADSQQKARIAAAEKAKEEAERLLEEKRLAEEEAEKRAQEIAERTKELLKRREDKKKAQLEVSALAKVQKLTIGAWVSLTIGDQAERYKLVVKIAASSKFIFVDKLGIKKKEYKEVDLVDLVVTNKMEFLSDGAEFEDSLQRVVSRLRMAK